MDKEFGKRSNIGSRNKIKNNYIDFEEPRKRKLNINYNYNNVNKDKNQSKKVSNGINNGKNYNWNSHRNSKYENNTTSDENKTIMSHLNKTIELNKDYKDLYNFIDERNDRDITKFFGNYVSDFNTKIEESNKKLIKRPKSRDIKLSEKKNKNLCKNDKKSLTPKSYNTFDYLNYKSDKEEEIRKKQELYFKRKFPFKPTISPYAKELKNKNKESTKQFINRISKNTKEKKDINLYKRINIEKTDLQRIKNEDENEKKNINKDNIIKMKIKKYRELFNLLDSNKDGLISSSEIELTKIEENFLQNIFPILEELNKTKKKMDFKEFCIKIDKLMTQKKFEKNI